MTDDGDTKDDVKVPDGEVGEKINRLFKEEEKDTSEYTVFEENQGVSQANGIFQTLSF